MQIVVARKPSNGLGIGANWGFVRVGLVGIATISLGLHILAVGARLAKSVGKLETNFDETVLLATVISSVQQLQWGDISVGQIGFLSLWLFSSIFVGLLVLVTNPSKLTQAKVVFLAVHMPVNAFYGMPGLVLLLLSPIELAHHGGTCLDGESVADGFLTAVSAGLWLLVAVVSIIWLKEGSRDHSSYRSRRRGT